MDLQIDKEDFFDENVNRLLKETAESEGFSEYSIEKSDGSEKGDGYTGIIKTVSIISKSNNKILNLVVKGISKSDSYRSQIEVKEIFDREIHMYRNVFTAFKTFEEERNLPVSDFAPRFYNSLMKEKSETLILENLKESGYKLYERRVPMDEDHVRLVLTQYSRLHALSFALRDQHPEQFKNVVGCLDDHFIRFMLKTDFVENFIRQCLKVQETLNGDDEKEVLDTYKAFVGTIRSFFEDLLQSVDEYSVMMHGDCWTNNMMFKYEDKTNPTKPTQIRLFDFQTSRPGSPVLDLSYFLYSCSSIEIIDNLDRYLHLYYSCFSEYLQQLGSDPNKVFPYSTFQKQWKKYSRYGLIISPFVIHIMLTEKEEAVDLDSALDANESVKNVFCYKISKFEQYVERVKPIILHFVKNKLI